jgi:hypothetical protein
MTREEEINNASYAYWVNNYANIEFIDEEEKELHTQDIQESFINGAEWADSHPQHIEIPAELSDEIFIEEAIKEDWKRNAEVKWKQMEMYYFNKFLNKACDWLEETFKDGEVIAPLLLVQLIDKFREAMKGE